MTLPGPAGLRMILCKPGTVQQLCSTSRAYPGLLQGLLLVSKSIEVLADYQISQYLNYLVNVHLCIKVTSTEVHQYHALLINCGCP